MKPAEAYILRAKEPLKSILMHVSILIESHFKEAELKFKWKIPFYYLNNNPLCYLNATNKGYVDVGFYLHTNLSRYNQYLVKEKRKLVRSLRYYHPEEIDKKIIIAVLTEAYQIKNNQ